VTTLLETVRVVEGVVPLWSLHVARLTRSAEALGIALPPLEAASGGDDRVVRYAVGAHGVQIVERDLPAVTPIALATSPAPHRGYPHKVDERGWLEAARLSVQSLGADDALLLDANGMVVEASQWAIGWWQGEELHFPPLFLRGLPSVGRARLGEAVRGGIRATPLARDALAWRSLVACNAARGLVPVLSLDGEPVPGNLRTEAVMKRFWLRAAG
jgi:branched-subunit amino acid aminotransferase/4-amino-4-deoxychorismate lyase